MTCRMSLTVACSRPERKAKLIKNCLLFRLVGFKQVKLKVEAHNAVDAARLAQRWLGPRVDLRVDANMAWDVDQAREAMVAMKALRSAFL